MVKLKTKRVKTTQKKSYLDFKMDIDVLPTIGLKKYGTATIVDKNNFPVLKTFTSFFVEIYDDSMGTIHTHDCDEFGYVSEGTVQVYIWESETKNTMIEVPAGNVWFAPSGSLHSVNNVGDTPAVLYVGFNSPTRSNIDISVMLNGLPHYLKNEYAASPHSLLKNFVGPNDNYIFTTYPKSEVNAKINKNSPYTYNLRNSKPYFNDSKIGKIFSVDKSKWPILNRFSISHYLLEPNVSTSAFWYSSVDALYIICKGNANMYMTLPGYNNTNEKNKVALTARNYFFVPKASQHVICNSSSTNTLDFIVFFSDDTHKMISLSESLLFFG